MEQINFDDFKCRASAAHKLLSQSRSNPCITEKQQEELADLEKRDKLTPKQQERLAELVIKRENSQKIVLSDTCIEYLMEWYALNVYGKLPVSKEAMYIQYVEKGLDVEKDSIDLLSIVEGELYSKNEERVANDFLTGIPDIYKGENIMSATRITDIKSAWDYPTFLKKINCEVTKSNDLQLKCYMDITGAQESEVAHVLVNMPFRIIDDLRRSLLRQMNVVTEESPEFMMAWNTLLESTNFDNIPIHKRVYKVSIEPFSETERQQLYDRVKCCREWLWKFDEMYQSINLPEEIIERA